MAAPLHLTIRDAVDSDVDAIHLLLAEYAKQHLLLNRSPEDIRYHLDNFVVAEKGGEFVGCCALRYFGSHLYEVRSLAIAAHHSGQGIASRIVQHLIDKMETHKPCRIFALTYHAQLFIRMGFHPASKELFPPKIWCDCSQCAKRDHCDEDAVMLELE